MRNRSSRCGAAARICALALALFSIVIAFPAVAQAPLPQKLGAYKVDPNAISVSGISSGGYMASQVHVAYSAHLIGAGIIAGGPFRCAEAGPFLTVKNATLMCSATPVFVEAPKLEDLIRLTDQAGSDKRIDEPTNLCKSRIFLLTSEGDTKVPKPIVDVLNSYYRHYTLEGCPNSSPDVSDRIRYQVLGQDIPHAFVTDDFGKACAALAKDDNKIPFICKAPFDTAKAILETIYGPLQPKTQPVPANLIAFDQTEFIQRADSPPEDSMNARGHIYVPSSCANQTCRLHIAFHGCLQSEQTSGDAFYAHAGYNEWAESNGIIVLYPQAKAFDSGNPEGCWDFWGYNGPDWWWGYDDPVSSCDTPLRAGPQMWAIRRMINRVAGAVIPDRLPSPEGPTCARSQ